MTSRPAHAPDDHGLTDDLSGIEVVELSDIDLDFQVEEVMRKHTRVIDKILVEPATGQDLAAIDLFHHCRREDLDGFAGRFESVYVVPGYILLHPGRLNSKVHFLIEGQLRLYANLEEKRPRAIVDMGQVVGLDTSLTGQPVEHAVVATEESHLLVTERTALDKLAGGHHGVALGYLQLFATYLRGVNMLSLDAATRARTGQRPGYVDEVTWLHNQRWLDSMFPRLVSRYRLAEQSLAVLVFAVNDLDGLTRQFGSATRDAVLREIAERILQNARPTDLLALDGKRRFVAILPGGDDGAAQSLGQRLEQAVAALKLTSVMGKPLPAIGLTMTTVALAANEPESDLLRLAEEKLAKAGSAGAGPSASP